jgi:broad specificity phosphatase PhoE
MHQTLHPGASWRAPEALDGAPMSLFPNYLDGRSGLNNRYVAVRHTRALSNEAGRLVSRADGSIPDGVTPAGRTEIDLSMTRFCSSFFGQRTPRQEEVVVMHSPLPRHAESAAVMGDCLERIYGIRVELVSRPELRERYWGDLEGAAVTEWERLRAADLQDPRAPHFQAESTWEMYLRLNSLVAESEGGHAGKCFFLVSSCDPHQALEALVSCRLPRHYSEIPPLRLAEMRELKLREVRH